MKTGFVVSLELEASFARTTRASRLGNAMDCTSVCTIIGGRVGAPSGLLRRIYRHVKRELFGSFPAVRRVVVQLSGRGPPVNDSYEGIKMRMRCAQ